MRFDAAAFFAKLDPRKIGALVETMVLAAHADGEFGPEERAALGGQIGRLVAGTPLAPFATGQAIAAQLRQAETDLSIHGRDKLLSAIKAALPDPESRKGALGLATLVVAADGIVRTSERELILDLAEALEIDRDEAADLVQGALATAAKPA